MHRVHHHPSRRPTAPRALEQTGPGASSPKVVELQRALKAAGLYPYKIDGWFGPRTRAALVAFQAARGIGERGKAGRDSWEALRREGHTRSAWNDVFHAHAPVRRGPGNPPRGPGAPAREPPPPRPGQGGPSSRPSGPGGATQTGGPGRPGIDGMLDWAKSMIGTPYAAVNPFRFGDVPWDGKTHRSVNGSGSTWRYPKGTRVFDCSGFVVAAFRRLGVDLAARGIASSSTMRSDRRFLQTVGREALAPGDLITYSPKNGVGHVVIYVGNGKAIESAGGVGVTVRDVNWARADGFRRVPLG